MIQHHYSLAQAESLRLVTEEYLRDPHVDSVKLLASLYRPQVILLKIRSFVVDNGGGGGYSTEYVAVDFDGLVVRDAARRLDFANDDQRITFFSELQPVNLP